MKQLLLCFWAYASCHVTSATNHEQWTLASKRTLFSFWKWGICGDTHPHSRAFSPVLGSGVSTKADHLTSDFQISLGFTRTLSAPSKTATTSLDKTSEGLLWLGTLSIHRGMSKPSSTSKMTLIMSSLLSLADHVLRKEPLTDSLSVNRTTFRDFKKLCHDLTAARTAIVSNSCITVFCPLDMISSNVSLSTLSLKKNKVFFDMSTTMPPRPLYLSLSNDAST